jgi:hypothetical protein
MGLREGSRCTREVDRGAGSCAAEGIEFGTPAGAGSVAADGIEADSAFSGCRFMHHAQLLYEHEFFENYRSFGSLRGILTAAAGRQLAYLERARGCKEERERTTAF